MFIGMAKTFRQQLGVPVVCQMTGEDIFLDAMKEPDRSHIQAVIRGRAGDVTKFVATSDYYARQMAAFLDIPREQIEVVYTGISQEYFSPIVERSETGPPTVGYLARICSEKGLGRLIDAMDILRKMPGMADVRLKVAGYLGGKDHKWFDALRKRIHDTGMEQAFDYLGEVDLSAKMRMLDSIDVFSVPTAYPEAKGIYILEAMARGVPVVQPAHGSFPELLDQTGGGILVPPGDARALAAALADLLSDAPRRRALGAKGRDAVKSTFTEEQMAEKMLEVFHGVCGQTLRK